MPTSVRLIYSGAAPRHASTVPGVISPELWRNGQLGYVQPADAALLLASAAGWERCDDPADDVDRIVVSAAQLAAMLVGRAGVLYVLEDPPHTWYRWDGAAFSEVGAGPVQAGGLTQAQADARYAALSHAHPELMTPAERAKLGALPDNAALTGLLAGKVGTDTLGVPSGVAQLDSTGKLKASQLPASALVDVSATGATLSGGVLTLTQDEGGPDVVVDLNAFATDAEVAAALAGRATPAEVTAAIAAHAALADPHPGMTVTADQISDAGAAGRELLRKGTMAEIQASVSDAGITRTAMAVSPRLSRGAIGLLSLTPAVVTGFFGDSLTNDTGVSTLGPQEYYTHAIAASKGAIVFGGKFGQGGMGYFTPGSGGKTFAQAKADLLAAIAAGSNIQRMCVLLGTNDFGAGSTFVQVRDETIAFVAWLEALGIEVVLSEIPPRNDYSASAPLRIAVHTFNVWVNRYCRLTGRRCQHFYSACVDRAGSGNWATGLNRDSIHPNPAGAKAMGLASWNAMSPAYQWVPYLAMDNGDATGHPNPLMLTDARASGSSAETAADGVPDYWGKANAYSGTVTPSIVSAGADAFGSWMRQDIAAGTNVSATTRSFKISAVPGDIIQVGFRLKLVTASNGAGCSISVSQCAGTSWITANGQTLGGPIAIGGAGLLASQTYSEDTTFVNEYKVAQAGTLGVSVDFQHNNVGLGGGQLNFGQFTLRNLTLLGVA